MLKKIFCIIPFFVFFFYFSGVFAEEEIKLISYYPAPYGAYKQIMVGSGVKQPLTANTTTKERIGVIDDTVASGEVYLPAQLEVGGIAKFPTGTTMDDIGIFTRGTAAGIISSSDVIGVQGKINYTTPVNYNIDKPYHYAVFGDAVANTSYTSGIAGVYGTVNVKQNSMTTSAYGVYGFAEDYGVYGLSSSYGVYGKSTGTDITQDAKNSGVYGEAPYKAIEGKGTGTTSCGVYAYCLGGTIPSAIPANKRVGVYAEGSNYGVWAKTHADYAVYGSSPSVGSGIVGYSKIGTGVVGISADAEPSVPYSNLPSFCGGYFEGKTYGISAKCTGGSGAGYYAGYFTGNVFVNGNFASTNKYFVIDHPVKEGMSLRHACMEGPEAGIYQRGRVKLVNKEAIIELPDYFKALSRNNPSISLTPVGELALVSYKELEKSKKYRIFSDKDNIEVDWIVLGKREDIVIEEKKTDTKEDEK
jgi:hypothetical protein